MSKTKAALTIAISICCLAVVLLSTKVNPPQDEKRPSSSTAQQTDSIPKRIVSLSPSITEILFAIGLGDNVVGVTRFCKYPEKARSKAEVGGFQDLSLEQVVALSPDLVLHLPSHSNHIEKLKRLGVNTMQIDTGTVNGIYSAISEIGKRCGREDESSALIANLKKQVDTIKEKWQGSPDTGIMIIVSRSLGEGEPKEIYAAGPGTFYHDLLKILGARNVCEPMKIKYPKIGRESLLRLNPDVIIDLLTDMETRKGDVEGAKKDWDNVGELAAVKNHRVCIITESYAVVPGPRFVKLMEKIGETVNAGR